MERDFAGLLAICRRGGVEVRSDSRLVRPGDIFVAVPGATEDGARYMAAAVRAGAGAVVCRLEDAAGLVDFAGGCRVVCHGDPREALWRLAAARWRTDALSLTILGVTGTNGKTTCAYLLEHLYTKAGFGVGVMGTVSYRWPGYSEPAPLTTPDPLRVHSMLAQMAEAGVDVVVMEISSHAMAQQRVGGVPFAGALFSNLTQDHLDYHENMEEYFQAKAKLFLEMPRVDKAMAVNADDAHGRRLLELCPAALSFGLRKRTGESRHLRGEMLHADTRGCGMRMRLEGRQWELRSPLVGAFNASNLLAVQALALEMGLEPAQLSALESFSGVCGRLERIDNPQGLDVFVDYAHTPDALVNVLKSLRQAGFSRIITVFGCGGDRDRGKRPLMGAAVARYSDVAVLTSDNPRFEDPESILQDVLPGLKDAREVLVEVDRRAATERALAMLRKGDALLIAGKGHENYQIIQGVKSHYSDQEVVREILRCT
ncbi:MAG: UDP-N-acetylmuramoyl-L-alanyl-D-glutamate--2,6-diaminopimelate ligase [Desulfovibrio sp.]|jgi:UDP-N-acetylmuramoyl-L-alanyl-D-glutamate--2,6-diaminopimelate ligase|nr:UDP-N-acetylmuramoyl-L-alanyl-D-glutamate--2,6-diaminopimelate ligase [Desulfovibrio sp.]